MRESVVELHLKRVVQRMGGEALKFTSPGRRHVQDRLVILPGNGIWFVETKAPGKRLRPGQLRFRARLEFLGCRCMVLDTKEKVDQWAAHVGAASETWRTIL